MGQGFIYYTSPLPPIGEFRPPFGDGVLPLDEAATPPIMLSITPPLSPIKKTAYDP